MGVALLAALSLVGSNAHAQTVADPTITVNPVVTRKLPNGDAASIRGQGQNPTGISFADCDQDVVLNFSLALGGLPQNDKHVEAWVGSTDCTPLTARSGTTAVCKPAAPLGISANATTTVPVHARDIVANQSDNPKPVNYTAAGKDVCTTAQKTSGALSLSVYFMWLDGAGNPFGTAAKYDLKTDMVGPNAPSSVSAGDGDRILVVSWKPATDTDTQGFVIYCDPVADVGAVIPADSGPAAPTTETTCVDGGLDDGGLDEAGNPTPPQPIDGGCTTINVTPDAGDTNVDPTCPKPTFKNECARVGGNTSTNAILSGRTNGTRYTVAVAATDAFGNSGTISTASCATPGPVDDFWKKYREAGGQAGGGFCALEHVGAPAGMSLFALVTAAAAVSFVRRRRRR
ncbi:MAG: hypothetical protein JWM74_5603 [Myxococcaceae bacterium]|nr:hypothetical protein [Myxococcaceae bacterium]